MESAISIYKDAYAVQPKDSLDFNDYLEKVKNGEWEPEVMMYRTGQAKKTSLPAVMASGLFEGGKTNENLITHSGFIAIDIDAKENPQVMDWGEIKQKIATDPFSYAVHDSCSGNGGFVIYVKIDPTKHLDSFLGLEDYYLNEYNVFTDKSCKNVSRLRFVSFDTELTKNEKSKVFKNYLKPVKKEIKQFNTIIAGSDLDYIFQQHREKCINLTEDYNDWLKMGFAMYEWKGLSGSDYFHQLSATSAKYDFDETENLWKAICKRGNRGGEKITLKTFLWECKNKGIDVRTPLSKRAENTAILRRKSIGRNGGAKNEDSAKDSYIKTCEMEGIDEQTANDIWEQTGNVSNSELKIKRDDQVSAIKDFLTDKSIKFNEITRNYEIDGNPLIDRDFNSVFIQACELIDSNLNRALFNSVLDSNFIPAYNPILEFFNKNKRLNPSGHFQELCNCIDAPGIRKPFVEKFLKKWLLGVVSSAHGTYSVLVLVLTGGQGIGKTEFFRNLLPDELQSYYAESKLDEGKDAEILMTKKLIILDDEFGGKSKKDAKKFKELSSRQHFTIRRPYGRASEELNRLAVLCGTTNEKEILNDFTGNRRIIPFNIRNIDHKRLKEIDKTALFMELYHEWKKNPEGFMLTKNDIDELNEATADNEQISAELELVMKYFIPVAENDDRNRKMTNSEIMGFLNSTFPTIKLNPQKLGQSLTKIGIEQKSVKIQGVTKKIYNISFL